MEWDSLAKLEVVALRARGTHHVRERANDPGWSGSLHPGGGQQHAITLHFAWREVVRNCNCRRCRPPAVTVKKQKADAKILKLQAVPEEGPLAAGPLAAEAEAAEAEAAEAEAAEAEAALRLWAHGFQSCPMCREGWCVPMRLVNSSRHEHAHAQESAKHGPVNAARCFTSADSLHPLRPLVDLWLLVGLGRPQRCSCEGEGICAKDTWW